MDIEILKEHDLYVLIDVAMNIANVRGKEQLKKARIKDKYMLSDFKELGGFEKFTEWGLVR